MRSFRPTIKNTLLTLLVFPVLMGLGFWQLDRADQKHELASAFAANAEKRAVEISGALVDRINTFQWFPVAGQGIYSGPNILLDNRTRDGMVGYEILTPMSAGGVNVLVNRGWISAPAKRDLLPDLDIPSGEQSYTGKLGPTPATGVAINEYSDMVEQLTAKALRIQLVNLNTLESFIDKRLIDGVVYLDPDSPNGFRRDWQPPGFRPEKHEAYATQWFSMAGIVLILYIALNLRPDSNANQRDLHAKK